MIRRLELPPNIDLAETIARYEQYVDRSSVDGCHPWIGSPRNSQGYGGFGIGRKIWMAHRVGWILRNGPIPEGMVVRHTCDNPPCQNPDHWLLGTQKDNMADREERGRGACFSGGHNPAAVMTPEQVAEARSLYTGERGQQVAIARRFGVSKAQMSKILNGTSWVAAA